MTYTEAIKALLDDKSIEVVSCAGVLSMRMHDKHGPQVEIRKGDWVDANSGYGEFREVFKPRLFLGVWEEVKTWEEADYADPVGQRRMVCSSIDGIVDHRLISNDPSAWVWVRRIQPKAVPIEELRDALETPPCNVSAITCIRALIAKYEGGK